MKRDSECAALGVLVAVLILAIAISFIVNVCTVDTEAATNKNTIHRFTVEAQQTSGFTTVHIITDNETGVQYLYYRSGAGQNGGSGLTKLEVSDGN